MKLRVRIRVCSKTTSFLISVLYVVFLFPICSFTSFVVLTLRTLTAKIYQSACQKLRRWSLKRGSIICGSWGGVTLDASSATKQQKTMNACFQHFFAKDPSASLSADDGSPLLVPIRSRLQHIFSQ